MKKQVKDTCIRNHFDVLGKGETGCTRALASLLAKRPELLNEFPPFEGNPIPQSELKTMRVYAEDALRHSRYDIHCVSEGYNIVIEAKVNANTVGREQIEKYLERMGFCEGQAEGGKAKKQHLVLLTQLENQPRPIFSEGSALGVDVSHITWCKVLEAVNKCKEEFTVNFAEELNDYMKRSIGMKVYTDDVAAVVVSDAQAVKGGTDGKTVDNTVLWEAGYHRGKPNVLPLFIARREWTKDEKRVVIDTLYRVEEIYMVGVPSDEEEMRRIYAECGFNGGELSAEMCLYKFDKEHPLKLEKPSDLSFEHHQQGIDTYTLREVLSGNAANGN